MSAAVIARAHREGHLWVVHVPGVGTTQTRWRWRIKPMVRDLCGAVYGYDARELDVEVMLG